MRGYRSKHLSFDIDDMGINNLAKIGGNYFQFLVILRGKKIPPWLKDRAFSPDR